MVLAFMGSQFPVSERRKWICVCITRRLASAARKWKKNQLKCRADGASRRVCFKEIQSASLESGFGVYNPPTSVGGSKSRIVGGTNWNKQNVEPMAQAVGLVLFIENATCQSLNASLEAH
jgi:hypothetical protein